MNIKQNYKKLIFYRLIRSLYRSIIKVKVNEGIDKANEITLDEKNSCLEFYINYQDFRTPNNCARITGVDKTKVLQIKELLYKERALGIYFFEDAEPPQKYMLMHIQSKLQNLLNSGTYILEIGPGENPIFQIEDYPNWYGVDRNFDGEGIDFNGNLWAKSKYPKGKIFNGSWENISSVKELNEFHGRFDIIVASHSYEHVFMPIKALIEASIMLKKGGYILLFVPDGFSDDPAARNEMTHTLYLVPYMIEEFFKYSEKFSKPSIETFRPNADYFIMAQKL